ncbi:hypothetical protein CC78DRAFT_545695 [Lojkania enalia]|uniref:Carrier domain-containing protein n=1 Tax=Lojkania enalia TaxID=147567 RepID=A0A9P4K5V4_9PLEO|nr:hypothetical protein CC78DRAFT_545695 [Didymosphaeria enalia]
MSHGPIPGRSILNRHPTILEGPTLLHELVRINSSTEQPAVDFLEHGLKRRTLSYQSLHAFSDELARRIGHALAGLEHTPAIIPVLLPQSPELYVALLAILKAGKAFCPLSLDTPEDRLGFILKDVSAILLVTDSTHKAQIPLAASVRSLIVDLNSIAPYKCAPVGEASPNATDLAYVLYTSGSTGLPKAVCISHSAITQSLLAHDRHIPEFSRFLQFAAPTFDVSIFEIFFPWFRGCTLVGCTRGYMIEDLPGTINGLEVDAAELTPTVVSNFLKGRKSVPTLKLLLTIGEMLSRHVIEEFGGDASKPSLLWGMYGPTEAAIHCSLQPSFHSSSSVGNIGFPLDTVTALVVAPLSEDKQPTGIGVLPVGEVGELVLGGPQLAREYLNRPELTTGAFIKDSEFGHLYRTGDKARILPNGTIECLGRIIAGQVKIRGQRVELGEIEEAISRVDGCHSVAAVVIEGTLVAFCAIGSSRVTEKPIKDACKRWLPAYMIPSDIILLPRMPHLTSGKIDRKALETQYFANMHDTMQEQDLSDLRMMNDAHLPILRILETVLSRKVASRTALGPAGLDSLRSIRIASMLREIGYTPSAVDVLSAATFEDLVAVCYTKYMNGTSTSWSDSTTLEDAISGSLELSQYQAEILQVIPCSPLQEAMLAETIIRPDAYCNWIEVELSEPYTFFEIRNSVQKIAQGNEILRSGFYEQPSSGSRPFVQIIWKELSDSQITEVSSFSKKYSLGSAKSLLRPFTVQVNPGFARSNLLFQIHHALYDGWSVDIILHDLSYVLRGNALAARPHYCDVVKYFYHVKNDESKAYWRKSLDGYRPTPLPNFNGRTVRDGTVRSISGISSVDSADLSKRASEYGINAQVFFQGALAYLTSSYIGSSDVVIGTVTSGRTIPVAGIEDIVGPCIASLPLRIDFSKYNTISDMLRSIQDANRTMLRHCTLPLRDIAKLHGLRSGTRLFDVLFVWQQSLFSDRMGDVGARVVDSEDNLEFKVTLEFEPRHHHIHYRVTYDSTFIPDKQIEHLRHQVDELVESFLRQGNESIRAISQCFHLGSLSIANPKPKRKTFQHGPAHAVEHWAKEEPGRKAVVLGQVINGTMVVKEQLTYAALNSRANKLARALLEYQPKEDQLICILLDKSINLYVSILAVLKIGSGYLPIVPDSPPERTRKTLEDAQVQICISDSRNSKHLRRQGLCTVLDIDNLDLSVYSGEDVQIRYCGSNLAYAVFTSGSTGTPKGVLVTQDNLMSNLDFLFGLYPTSSDSRLLQSCSQAFDVSVFEIFFAWYACICLCTATKDDLYYNLVDAINHLGITHLSLTPTVASLVSPGQVPNVEFLVTAGEPLNEHVRRQWAGRGLYQGYGPSETTNICTIRPSVTIDDLINNIGIPFSNTSAFVLQPNSDIILPRGAVGELCFGGAQVFRGYLNMPDLNKKKILEHPIYGRIYRSGDMGILLSDDSILFTGRYDDQVKVRGQRVELGEISTTVLDISAVEDSVTLLLQHGEAERLVSFWVPKGASTASFEPLPVKEHLPSISTILESVSLKLPSYMVPTHLIPITRIPVTTQTKVDKQLLRRTFETLSNESLELSSSHSISSSREPQSFSEQEKRIVQALAETLRIWPSDIQRTSSFFNIGLDSVSAIQFSRLLREAGLGNIPISVILKHPTVARLSPHCIPSFASESSASHTDISITQALQENQAFTIRSTFERRGVRVLKVLPCTPLQEGMLSSTPLPGKSLYCNTLVFDVTGDASHLRECWSLMFRRHEILRTAFVPTEDPHYAFAQVVVSYEEPEWDQLRSDQEPEVYAQEVLPGLLKRCKPPVRLAMCQSNGPMRMIFCCHHALYDATAINTLLDEVEKAYFGINLPPPVPYERYLQHMLSQDFDAADRFWESMFHDFKPVGFPNLSGRSRQNNATSQVFSELLHIPLGEVLTACQEQAVSLLSMVQATWAKLLYFYLGEDDFCFGNVVSGRALPEIGLDRLVAPCFNTIPVRVNFDFGQSNEDLVQKMHNVNIDSLPFHLTPLRRIRKKAREEAGSLFNTLVILQQPSAPLNGKIWTLEKDYGEMDLPIVCEVAQDKVNDRLVMTLHYSTSLLSTGAAEVVSQTFDRALSSCIRYTQSAARDTVGFPPQLLAESNLKFSYLVSDRGVMLYSGFERNAMIRPDTTSLDFQHVNGERTTWTFKMLNEEANQIAHTLLEHEITPEDFVPIHISKSPQFYASILGVLKAGAAFTPIHPDLPEARKQFILSELQPKVMLITNGFSSTEKSNLVKINVDELKECPKENPVIQGLTSRNLAYCLYTSGSTGIPKAVAMDHEAPLQTIESSRTLIPWNHKSRLLQYAATTFDMCYYDCFLAWTFGFTLCAADQSAMLNDISSIIKFLDIDLLDLTPSVVASIKREEVPSIKWLYCIGEPMTPDIVKNWEDRCVNSYGPTEAAFCTTIFPVKKGLNPAIIGAPFPTTSFAVFPKQGQRTSPVFGVGELYIGGAQLARAYHGRPELTEEKFVQRNGQRFYKSGDMVRMLSDGNFEFLGRADDQVKIRGLRVELGEINHTLQESDAAVSAVTTQIMRKDDYSKDQLVAFFTVKVSIQEYEPAELKEKAKRKAKDNLPSYMVPQFYIILDKIPRSAAGKVDRSKLLKIFQSHEDDRSFLQGTAEEQKWTQTEMDVRELLSRLSRTPAEEIYPMTSIYELGLDSISAGQIAAALRKKGLAVNAADVLKHPTCAELAVYIQDHSERFTTGNDLYDFDSFEAKFRPQIMITDDMIENVECIRPCTPAQSGMVAQFILTDGTVYFNHLRLQLDAGIHMPGLKGAWDAVMKRHRMLRTGFVPVKDKHHAFAMVHYAAQSTTLPWDEKNKFSNQVGVDDWLDQIRSSSLKHLHRPPWCIRVVEQYEQTFLDFAILHALFDARSLQIIFQDVADLYKGLPNEPPAPLEPVSGFILNASKDETCLGHTFWRKLGENAVPARFPNLSPLRVEPTSPSVHTKNCTKALYEYEQGCRASNITLQAAGIASWASILSEYTGETTVTFGVVLSGRTFEAADSAAFPCITTVPFVCRVSDDKKRMLKDIMYLNAEIQQYQFAPLTEVQKQMGFPNEPLFDSIFALQKTPGDEVPHGCWTVVDENASIDYPLSIELEPRRGRLELRLTYLPHLVTGEQAILLLDQLDHLLDLFIFSDSQGLTPEVYDGNLYSITPPQEVTLPSNAKLLHELVEISVNSCPSSVALEFATSIQARKYTSRKWTYAELHAEGNRVANLLISHKVKPGQLVCVCFDKCPEASFAMLGILKAGCAFVALDPGAPSARKAFIVKDSNARVALSLKAYSSDLPMETGLKVLNLDDLDLRFISTAKPALERPIDPQDCSYCLYTSGTTGTPKGCEITHENAVQAILAFQRLFAGHWNEESRWLQFASFHFDVSVLEQYWSWSVGICVVSAPRDIIFEDLATSIRTLSITHIDLTPSLARILHPDDVPSLCKGVFITGGESLKQEILDAWGSKGVIYNGYGPTETTIGVTMYPRVPFNGKPSNIGPQFDNVGSFVLKPGSDIPVLRGGIGELCVSGKLVGKGYLNNEELTKQRFPYIHRFGERVYRTGDLVRILHDSSFDFIGRADDQVKLRGQRLEIGEINSVIKHSGDNISDVATLVLKHPKQQKNQLVSFLVPTPKANGKPKILLEIREELRNAKDSCRAKLPGYMVPTHFIALTALPLSANNKADSRRLKDMYDALSITDLQLLSRFSSSKDERWSIEEQKIRVVVSEVLNVDQKDIRKESTFFELGLDSLSAIGLSKALKEAGFSKAKASIIMKHTSIDRLAKVFMRNSVTDDRGTIIASQQAIAAVQHRHRRLVAELLCLDNRGIEALAPCTPLQQGMIARSLEKEHGLYFNSFHFRLAEGINEDTLRTSWEHAFDNIPILRTAFANTEDGYVQAVLRRRRLPWQSHVLPESETMDTYLDRLRREWCQQNGSVLGKPFEVILVSSPESRLLTVHMFHALYDGNSIGLIFRAFLDIYNGRWDKGAGPYFLSVLPYGPLRIQPGAEDFWGTQLAGDTFRPFPSLGKKPANTSASVIRDLKGLSEYETVRRRLSVTQQAIAQACWTRVLHKYTKGDVTLGIVVSGRSVDFKDVDNVIGPLFNTIPYRYRPRQRESWGAVIQRTHAFNVEAYPFQHTPLRNITKWCKRSLAQPLFDNLFAYQVSKTENDWAKNGVWELIDGGAEADYPLAIEIEQTGSDCLKLTLVTQNHISDEEISGQLLDEFEVNLKTALADPDAIIETLDVNSDEIRDSFDTVDQKLGNISTDGMGDFEWSYNAKVIREEIAILCGIETKDIGATTSILELGLDSVDAIRLSSKLNHRGIELPVSDILRGLTIANMSKSISTKRNGWKQQPSDMIFKSHKRRLEIFLQRRQNTTDDIEAILPLTPLQEGMFAEMVSSNFTRYYNHDVLRLAPDTDLQRLQQAWMTVVEGSPILRTSIIEIDDPSIDFSFAQVVHRAPHDFWIDNYSDELDFSRVMDSIRDDAARMNRRYRLFHIHVVKSQGSAYLILSITHALYDGWSLALLHHDVHCAYVNQFTPRPNYEYALCNILTMTGADAVSFWRDYLTGANPSLFLRRSDNGNWDSTIVHRAERVSQLQPPLITSFAKENNITFQALVQTAYALVLASTIGSLDVTFGSVLSGRDNDTISEMLFPTMNTVAIRTIIHGTRREMLNYVQENLSQIKKWQHFPLRKALTLAGVQGRSFESLFIYQGRTKQGLGKNRSLYESVGGHSNLEYPVCVEVEVVDEELIWRCSVRDDVFDMAETQDLLTILDNMLRDIIEDPGTPTIEVTEQGISIRGLPAFRNDISRNGNDQIMEKDDKAPIHSESGIAKVIREVLAVVSKNQEGDISDGMTIFHIGLDSISAIKVSSLLRKRGVILSVGEMLKAGTVQKMAEVVNKREPSTDSSKEISDSIAGEVLQSIDRFNILRKARIGEDDVEQILPATAGQVYMLSAWINSNGTAFYPEFRYRLEGKITFEELKMSWHALVSARPILRTCFISTKDNSIPYVQVVLRKMEGSLANITGSNQNPRLEDVDNGIWKQPYAYLFAAQTAAGWNLKLNIHHALYDGVSLPLLMKDFQNLCNDTSFSPEPDPFFKFIATSSTPAAIEQRKSFWSKYLDGIYQNHFPQPTLSPALKTNVFKPGLLPSISTLERISRKQGLSTQSLFLAIYAKLYACIVSTPLAEDVVIGVYLANRSHPILHVSQAAIPTLNLVPLRVSKPLRTDVLDIAAQIQYDIHDIGNPGNSVISLYEIDQWLGIKIDTFVNFLKLPEGENSVHGSEKKISIKQKEEWEGEVSRTTELEQKAFKALEEFVNEEVSKSYLFSIDVEATVRKGALDVGVFAPSEVLELGSAEKLIGDLKRGLEGLSDMEEK